MCEGFVMGVRTNGIQPKYGLESVIVLQQGKGTTIDIEEFVVRSGEHVIRELDRVNSNEYDLGRIQRATSSDSARSH
ncbi:hypothetical protein OSTOST_14909 [Ostertagia ostertagi]